jgi:hypothetical protein
MAGMRKAPASIWYRARPGEKSASEYMAPGSARPGRCKEDGSI